MNAQEANELFKQVYNQYKNIPTPKYKHTDLVTIRAIHEGLMQIKAFMESNTLYIRAVNAVSQTLHKLQPKEQWCNISERGLNKSVRPQTNRRGHDTEESLLWQDNDPDSNCYIKGYWDTGNYMATDVIGYFFMLHQGHDTLPKEMLDPLFTSHDKIYDRELEMKSPSEPIIKAYKIDSEAASDLCSRMKYWASFTDSDFRKFTSRSLSTTDISSLIHRTSQVEFKIVYPIRMKTYDKKKGGYSETSYKMNFFSRLFEFAYIDDKVRSDGVVRERRYYIFFNTVMGEMFAHNLMLKNYDFIDRRFYTLPETAQLFYRRLLIHNNFPVANINLDTIKERLNLSDTNITNLLKTIEQSGLEALKHNGFIESYKKEKGLNGIKYIIKKTNVKTLKESNAGISGVCKINSEGM